MPFKRLLRAAARRLPPSVRRFASAGAARRDASAAPVPPTPPVSSSRSSSCSVAANATALERGGDVLPSDSDLDRLLLEAASAAFAPECMVASASTSAPALEEEHVGSAAGSSPSATVFTDKFVIEQPVAEARSSPEALGLPHLLPPPQPAATMVAHGVAATNRYSTSSGEEYDSGEFSANGDNSSSDGSPWQSHRARHADAWVSPRRQEVVVRLLFAFIEPSVNPDQVSATIRAALLQAAPLLPIDLLQSSHGAMLLRFANEEERDSLRLLSPITADGSAIFLQKPNETANRFFRVPTWLAFVFVIDFPVEHWYEDKIRECFRSFANVAEIEPECLTGNYFGPLRLLLELNDRLELPVRLRISSNSGISRDGAVAKIIPIRVWPREFQLNSHGQLSSFFGPPRLLQLGQARVPRGPSLVSSNCVLPLTTSARCIL